MLDMLYREIEEGDIIIHNVMRHGRLSTTIGIVINPNFTKTTLSVIKICICAGHTIEGNIDKIYSSYNSIICNELYYAEGGMGEELKNIAQKANITPNMNINKSRKNTKNIKLKEMIDLINID